MSEHGFASNESPRARLSCPACGALVEFHLKAHGVRSVERDAQGHAVSDSAKRALQTVKDASKPERTEIEQSIIEAAERAGLMEPFEQAVSVVKFGTAPKDIPQFFVTFVRGLKQRLIPAAVLTCFRQLFNDRAITYYTAQGIGVVVVDGYMRLFVPNQTILGTRLRKLHNNKNFAVKMDDGTQKVEEWIRTKYGYVAGKGALADELHKRSFGDFALPDLHSVSIANR